MANTRRTCLPILVHGRCLPSGHWFAKTANTSFWSAYARGIAPASERGNRG